MSRPILRLPRPSPRFQPEPEVALCRSEKPAGTTLYLPKAEIAAMSREALGLLLVRLEARRAQTTDPAPRRSISTRIKRVRRRLRELCLNEKPRDL